jgi:hypothetical protein
MPEKYPQSEGAVFINDRKQNDKHPDWRGHIDITKAQINQLVKMGRAGQKVQLQLALWDRESQGGKEYMYVKAEAYMKDEDGDGWDDDRPQRRQSSGGHGRRPQRGTSSHRPAQQRDRRDSRDDRQSDDWDDADNSAADDFQDDDIPF